jgi:hypothetical protein
MLQLFVAFTFPHPWRMLLVYWVGHDIIDSFLIFMSLSNSFVEFILSWSLVFLPMWRITLSIFCDAGLLVLYIFGLCLSSKIFSSPLIYVSRIVELNIVFLTSSYLLSEFEIQRFGKFSAVISLYSIFMPLDCISASYSLPWIH